MEFVLYDRFKDVKFIAEGGFSKIYKATWVDGRIYAKKVINVRKIVQLYSKSLKEIASKE